MEAGESGKTAPAIGAVTANTVQAKDENASPAHEAGEEVKKSTSTEGKQKTKAKKKTKRAMKKSKRKEESSDSESSSDSSASDSDSSDTSEDERAKKRKKTKAVLKKAAEKKMAKLKAQAQAKKGKSKKHDSGDDFSSADSDSESESEDEKKRRKKKAKAKKKSKKYESSDEEVSSSSSSSSSSDSDSEDEKEKEKKRKRAKAKAKAKIAERKAKAQETDLASSSGSEIEKDDTAASTPDTPATSTGSSGFDEIAARMAELRAEHAKLSLLQQQQQQQLVVPPSLSPLLKKTKIEAAKADDKKAVPSKKNALEFKRVDQVWDSKIRDYKYTESAEEQKDDFDCVFTVRRRFGWDNKYMETQVDIKSKLLRNVLQAVFKDCKSISLVEDTPSVSATPMPNHCLRPPSEINIILACLSNVVDLRSRPRPALRVTPAY